MMGFHRRRIALWRVALVAAATLGGGLPGVPEARAADADRALAKELGLDLDQNRIQFHDARALAPLRAAWKQARNRGLRVVHLGDSHVQAGISTRALRTVLKAAVGDGGYGLIFPYSVAKTYAPDDYTSTYTGSWECGNSRVLPPKVPVGVLGYACRTTKKGASFTITFRNEIPATWRELWLFVTRQARRFDLEVSAGGRSVLARVEPASAKAPPYVRVRLPPVGDSITVRLARLSERAAAFEFEGMSLTAPGGQGAVVHAAGLGGAQFRAVLHEEFFERQLAALHPDLVIIDYGTNDYFYDDVVRPELQRTIRKVIQRVRDAAPNAAIVLTSAQDLYSKGRNVTSGPAFSGLIERIAGEEGCAFWDWFWIAGGPATLMAWQERGLARKDGVHLTARGYELKGRLLGEAFQRTIEWMNAHRAANSLVFERKASPRPIPMEKVEPDAP